MSRLKGLERDALVWKVFDYFVQEDIRPSQIYLFKEYDSQDVNIDIDLFVRKHNSNKILLVQTCRDNTKKNYRWAKAKSEFISEYYFHTPRNIADIIEFPGAKNDKNNSLLSFKFKSAFIVQPFMAYHAVDGSVGFFDLSETYERNRKKIAENTIVQKLDEFSNH